MLGLTSPYRGFSDKSTSPENPPRLVTFTPKCTTPPGGEGAEVTFELSLKSGTVVGPGVTVTLNPPCPKLVPISTEYWAGVVVLLVEMVAVVVAVPPDGTVTLAGLSMTSSW